MNTTPTDLWGQDIALDACGQALVAANGELILTEGVETGLQDVRLRLFTRLGELFYDTDFGSLIHDWIHEDSTATTRAAFASEIIMRVELDPRVVVGSVSCAIQRWDETSVTALLQFSFVGEDNALNLVLQANKMTASLVIQDCLPRQNSLADYV